MGFSLSLVIYTYLITAVTSVIIETNFPGIAVMQTFCAFINVNTRNKKEFVAIRAFVIVLVIVVTVYIVIPNDVIAD